MAGLDRTGGICSFAAVLGPGEAATTAIARKHLVSRVKQWLWLGDAAKAARATVRTTDATFAQRAHAAAQIARRAADSTELQEDEVSGAVNELYRQSIHWSLLALGVVPQARSGSSTEPVDWGALDRAVLKRAFRSEEQRKSAEHAFESLTFVELGAMPAEERARLGKDLRRLAFALLDEIHFSQRVREAVWATRLLRSSAVVLGSLLFGGGVSWALHARARALELARDLAPGTAWRASSLNRSLPGCKSPAQLCAESPGFFFQTRGQREPWIEFDLERSQQVSGARVVNRRDCCADRAQPLIIEVSNDHETWRTVARRNEVFSNWLTAFPPTQARWVRLRLDARATLHLARVRILR